MSLQPLPEAGPPLLTQYRFCSPWAFQPGVQPQHGVAALAALGTSSSGSLPPPVLTWCIGQCRRCGEETAEGHIYDDVPVRPLCELCVYFQQVLRPPQIRIARDSDTWSMLPFVPRLAEGPRTQTPQTTTVGTQTLSETRTTVGTQTVSRCSGVDTTEIEMRPRRRWKIHPGDWFCGTCGNHNYQFRDTCYNKKCPTIEFKRGDWMCSHCHNYNWAKEPVCTQCGETRTTMGTQTVSVGTQTWSEAMMRERKRWKFHPGDWFCEACGNHNFQFREACNNPHCPTIEFKPGDWICSRCHNHNWAKNVVCNVGWCRMIRPPPGLGGPPPPPGLTVRG